MGIKDFFYKRERTDQERFFDEFGSAAKTPILGFFLLVALYLVGSVFVRLTSSSDGVLFIFGHPIPHRALTGAFSAVCNLCSLMFVVFYKKPGFLFATITLVIQFPALFVNVFVGKNYSSIPGIFTNVLVIIAMCIIYTYVSRLDAYQKKIRTQAVTDRVTGLYNRFAIIELMKNLIKWKERFTLAVIKFSNLANISKVLGQRANDEALCEIARRLRVFGEGKITGERGFAASRNAIDFSVLLRNYDSEEKLREMLKGIYDSLSKKMTIDECDFVLTPTIGYASYPEDADDAGSLNDYAYAAMNHDGKEEDPIIRFDSSMMHEDETIEMELMIRSALENDRFYYYLQPQFDMDHKLRGFEALARMKDEDGNVVSPVDFIPVAEKAGLVDRIDMLVLSGAANFVGDLVRKTGRKLILNSNFSVHHLMRTGFVDEIKQVLAESGLPADQLEIEMTESIMIDSVEKAIDCLKQIHELGVRVAIDDFGTGYSSLSYLQAFPADVIKIDRSFVIRMNVSEASRQFVTALIAISHVMNYEVIAEGVEEEDQLALLKEKGCDYIQGFIWGKPMDPEEAAKLVQA